MPPKSFIQLLRKELRDAEYGIPGLDSERIEAVANKMPAGDQFEEKSLGAGTLEELLRHREEATAAGSTFNLWPGEDSDQWQDDFLQLLSENGRMVHHVSWDSGGPGAGADTEYIEAFLGRYLCRTSTDGLSGPYDSFSEVFGDEFRQVTSATERIWCSELTTEELLSKLILDEESLEPGFILEINRSPYVVTEEFRLIPAE